MIVDKIENLARYVALNPLFADVVAFLQYHDLRTLPNGSHSIHGDRLYVNVEDDLGKRREEAAVEYHRRMVDIQLPLNIPETYGFVPVDDLPPLPFDEDRDFAKSMVFPFADSLPSSRASLSSSSPRTVMPPALLTGSSIRPSLKWRRTKKLLYI